jgi:hypothetical protein
MKSVPIISQVQVVEPMAELVQYWQFLETVDGVAI